MDRTGSCSTRETGQKNASPIDGTCMVPEAQEYSTRGLLSSDTRVR